MGSRFREELCGKKVQEVGVVESSYVKSLTKNVGQILKWKNRFAIFISFEFFGAPVALQICMVLQVEANYSFFAYNSWKLRIIKAE